MGAQTHTFEYEWCLLKVVEIIDTLALGHSVTRNRTHTLLPDKRPQIRRKKSGCSAEDRMNAIPAREPQLCVTLVHTTESLPDGHFG